MSPLLLLVANLTLAQASDSKVFFLDAFKYYRSGFYGQSLDHLKKAPKDKASQATASYLRGLSLSRLQRYKDAITALKRAQALGSTAKDIDYEIGQAFYASQEFKKAANHFHKSAKSGYKASHSYYYIAYSSQVLEENKKAMEFYKKILELRADPDNIKQSAQFQLAEMAFAKRESLKNKSRSNVKKYLKAKVIPKYEKVVERNEESSVASQAKTRLREIENKYIKDPPKDWSLKLSQQFTYDDNVITQADEAIVSLSRTDAIVSKTSATGGYRWKWGSYELNPTLSPTFTFHSRRSTEEVYKNDELDTKLKVVNRYHHTLNHQRAAAFLNVGGDYLIRDYSATHTLKFYQWYWKLTLGEQANLLYDNLTIFQVSFKSLVSHDINYSGTTPGGTLIQQWKVVPGHMLTFLANASLLKTPENTDNNLNNYLLSIIYVPPIYFWDVVMTGGFSFSLADPTNRRDERGLETSINPYISFEKGFLEAKKLKLKLKYAFTKKDSKDKENYAYTKNAVTLGANLYLLGSRMRKAKASMRPQGRNQPAIS